MTDSQSEPTPSSPAEPPTPEPSKRRSRVLEYVCYLVALGCLGLYGYQYYRHSEAALPTGDPTGEIMSSLEQADRVPAPEGPTDDWNVLVLTMDTTRADHLGCYGHPGVRTPVIDTLARRGVLFAKAYTPSPSTLPGHSSIFTGLLPNHHGARSNGTFELSDDHTTLAEILKAKGYATGAFISAYVLDSRFGLDQGFDVYDDDLSTGVKHSEHCFRERPAQFTNESALKWLESVKDQKFFAWVHYFDAHAPYYPPEPIRSQYADHPYDGEIAYVDSEIGRLLDGLRKLGVLDKTLIVLAGDHGEGLGDHEEQTHSLLVYDSTLHTPLIICPPTKKPLQLAVQREVCNTDIVPTVLDMLNVETNLAFDGRSLLKGPEAEPRTLYFETISTLVLHGWSPLFGVRKGGLKYIHAPRPELYDTHEDPGELNDLIREKPQEVAALSRELEAIVGKDGYGGDALKQALTMDEDVKKQLAALGYLSSANQKSIDLTGAAAFDPKDMVPHFDRVQAASNMMSMGKFNEGLAELEACIAAVPNDVWTMQLLATAYLDKGDPDKAGEVIRRALELEKHEPGLYLRLAQVEQMRGQFEESERLMKETLELDPEYAPTYVSLGSLYVATGRRDEGMMFFNKAIELDPGTTGPHAYNAMGNACLAQMDLDAARDAFNKALELDRLNGNAHVGLASVLIEEGKLDEAAKALETAVQFMPADAKVLAVLAAMYNEQREHDKAIEAARKALSVNDHLPGALNALGSALRKTGDLVGAREAFEKALARHPRYVPCIINLAQVYLDQRQEERAAEWYRKALDVNPMQPLALFNMGTYMVNHGRPAEALAFYQKAVKVDPNYAMAHLHLGMVLLGAKGHEVDALHHLERSLELDPDLPERGRTLEIIERLRREHPRTTQPSEQGS